jgi:hypothetical protein
VLTTTAIIFGTVMHVPKIGALVCWNIFDSFRFMFEGFDWNGHTKGLPSSCDGCNQKFSVHHELEVCLEIRNYIMSLTGRFVGEVTLEIGGSK